MASLTQVKGQLNQLRRGKWARVVSDILSPPAVWSAAALPIALQVSKTPFHAFMWWGIFSILICLLPVTFIGLMVWRGKIGDIHMKERRERLLPLGVTLTLTALACMLLYALEAPPVLILLALFSLIQVAVIAAVTTFWQISMHGMGITGATIAVGLIVSSTAALIMTPLIVLVGAARLSLQRHTPAQVVAGFLVGAATPVILLVLFPQLAALLVF